MIRFGSETSLLKRCFVANLCTLWTSRIQQRAREKLKYLDSASDLRDLVVPPSNLGSRGSRAIAKGSSIRINKQWRICFKWKDGDAFEVEIVDYD